jgi:hypothetical protein
MKKLSGTIAMVLILVMLACSFTGCLSYVYRSSSTPMRVIFAIVDICVLPLSLLALLIYVIINDASGEMEPQIYLAGAGNYIPAEYLFLMEKIYSLPEAEFASLRQILDTIPETERSLLIERLNSLSETDRVSLVSAYTSLPETEIISSIKRINLLSETERVSLLQDFKSLSDGEIASLTEELKSLHEETDYIAAADYSREKTYMRLSFQQ